MNSKLLIGAAFMLAVVCSGVAADPLTVSVRDFDTSGSFSAGTGRVFAGMVATDLSDLSPVTSLPGSNAEGANEVRGKLVNDGGKISVVAEVTDRASGRKYGEMAEGGPEIPLIDLASQISLKIAALVLQVHGQPAANWSSATLADSPELKRKLLGIDGVMRASSGDATLLPGMHRITLSYVRGGLSTRADFLLIARPGRRYAVICQDAPNQTAAFWVADGASGAAVTTRIVRTWVKGDDLPVVHSAIYTTPTARSGAAVVADDQALYVLGGLGFGREKRFLTDIMRFDLRTQTTQVLTHGLQRRAHFGAALAAGKIYAIGGESWNSTLRSMQIFDLATGQLTEGPPMPEARRGFGTALLGDRIYVIGGSVVPPSSTKDVIYFDLARQVWVTAPSLERATNGPAVVVGNRIVYAGGFAGDLRETPLDRDETRVESLTLGASQWERLPALAGGFGDSAVAVLGGRIVMTSAFWDAGRSIIYNPATGESLAFRLDEQDERDATAIAVGEKMYVVGGEAATESKLRSANIRVYELNPNWSESAGVGKPTVSAPGKIAGAK